MSKEWIETSTAPKFKAVVDGFDGRYGYLWWLARYVALSSAASAPAETG